MGFKVEKGIPMPNARNFSTDEKYAFVKDMDVGDSILFNNVNTLASCSQYARRKFGFRGSQRQIGENRWRWWRIE